MFKSGDPDVMVAKETMEEKPLLRVTALDKRTAEAVVREIRTKLNETFGKDEVVDTLVEHLTLSEEIELKTLAENYVTIDVGKNMLTNALLVW